jgi:phage baseplate assembly protein gpV
MKKNLSCLTLLCSAFFLFGCVDTSLPNTTSVVSSSDESSTSDTSVSASSVTSSSSIPAGYGDFSITPTSNGSTPSYDATSKTYTIAVSSSKSVYTLSGYFEGSILIDNANALSSYKSVELILNNVYLRQNEMNGIGISYTLDEKYLEINCPASTINYVLSDGSAIVSKNNLRIGGDGVLNLTSSTAFGAKGDDMGLYGGLTLNVSSGSDGLHGKNLYTNNLESGTSLVNYSGTCSLVSGTSEQALDFCDGSGTTEDPYTGSIEVVSGASFVINGAGNVARCNTEFTIAGSVIATNIMSSPIITKVEGSLKVNVSGTFRVNGVDIVSETL